MSVSLWLSAIATPLKRTLVLWAVVLAMGLTGCVQSDIDVHYLDQHHGEIVQHIQLAQLNRLNRATTQAWLKQIDQRAKQLGGRTQKPTDEDVVVTIPFSNSKELESKFNQFFRPIAADDTQTDAPLDLPDIQSHLSVRESNLILVLRDHLSYDVDLRSLGLLSSEGNLLINPGTLFDLKFSLSTPWGAQSLTNALALAPTLEGDRLVWTLTTGEINHLEATFWIPSPLGIGTLVIVGFVALGMLLKALLTPLPDHPPT